LKQYLSKIIIKPLIAMIKKEEVDSGINKEWDLTFLYDMAKQAIESGDIKQSIKISERGLKEAKKDNDNDMLLRFNVLHSDSKEAYLKKRIETYIKRANQEENIYSYGKAIDFLKKADKKLNILFKLGKDTNKITKKIKDNKKKINELQEKKLKEKKSLEKVINQEKEKENVNEDSKNEGEIKASKPETEDMKVLEKNYEERIAKLDEEKAESAINLDEELFFNGDAPIEIPKEISEMIELPKRIGEKKSKEDKAGETKSRTKSTKVKTKNELLDKPTVKKLKKLVEKYLRKEDFFIIKKEIELVKDIYENIDLIALKIIRVSEILDLILILPVKISNLKGNILISEDDVEYVSSITKKWVKGSKKQKLLEPNINSLVVSQQKIFNELISEGDLFEFLTKYLEIKISSEKTMSKRVLFFRQDQIQYKLLIEPILVNLKDVSSLDKSTLPFPYRKDSNIHIVNYNSFPELIEYLKKKYVLIEKYSEKENVMDQYFTCSNKVIERVRLTSILLICFGSIFALIFFAAPQLIALFIQLSIASASLYAVIISYSFYQFTLNQRDILDKFNTPYYRKEKKIDDTSLILISDKIPNLMDQFIFEVFGEQLGNKAALMLEKNRVAKEIIEDEDIKKFLNEEEEDLIVRTHKQKKEKAKENTLKGRISTRYSSFLEED